MKMLLRPILTAFTLLSLLLCTATLVLWIRSYWIADLFMWGSIQPAVTGEIARSREITSCYGGILMVARRQVMQPNASVRPSALLHRTARAIRYPSWPTYDWRFLGFWKHDADESPKYALRNDGGRDYVTRGGTERRLTIPYWAPTGFF